MTKFVCGIDFGTTNTTLSVVSNDSAVQLMQLDGNSHTIASAVFFPLGKKAALYGQRAISAYVGREEGRFMRSFKRALGTSLMNDGTQIEGRRVSFEQIITQFVAHVKALAEQQVDAPILQAVVGRPVHFVDDSDARNAAAQKQLENAMLAAGFESVVFQLEPIGAAFAHELSLPSGEHLAIVLDIGGGTSDFSVIKLSQDYIHKTNRSDDVLANTGVRVGGNDFDRQLSLSAIMPELGMGTLVGAKKLIFPSYPFFDLTEWSKVQFTYTPKYKRDVLSHLVDAHAPEKLQRLQATLEKELGHSLLGSAERVKIELSEHHSTTIDLGVVSPDLLIATSRAQFEAAIAGELEKIQKSVQECLQQAGKLAADIDLVILTGGGTGVPAIRTLAQSLFPNASVSAGDMLGSVGLGLGYDAQRRFLK